MPYIGNIVQDFSVNNAMLNTDSVTSIKIDDGTIVNADINDSAAIAVSKLANFVTSNADNRLITGSGTVNTLNGESELTYSSPQLKLLSTSAAPQIRINSAADDAAATRFTFGRATANNHFVNGSSAGDSAITFGTNLLFGVQTAEKMRIDSSGNVGIGESASIDAKLHVNSGTDNATLFIESTDGDVNLCMADNAGSCRLLQSAGDLHFRTGGNANAFGTGDSERMVIDSSGNVGIGATSPVRKVHLHEGTSGNNFISFTNSTTGSTSGDGILVGMDSDESLLITNKENNHIAFATNNTERMRLDSSGRVQIGTIVGWGSNCKLHVSDTSSNCFITISAADNGNSVLAFSDTAATVRGALDYDHDGDFLGIKTASTERMRIDSSGRVMIGTTTAAAFSNRQLSVSSSSGTTSIELRSATNGDGRIIFTDSTDSSNAGSYKCQIKYLQDSDDFTISSNGDNERFRIDSSGNVGIGTTSPSNLLHVAGTLECNNIKILTVNSFETSANVFEGKGTNGARLRSALSAASTPSFSSSDDADSGMFLPGSNVLGLSTGGSEALRIDANQHVLINQSASVSTLQVGTPPLQVTNAGADIAMFRRNSNDAGGPIISLVKERNGAIVADGDLVGGIAFLAHDGTDLDSYTAQIRVTIDGTPGANVTPGVLSFHTSGASSNRTTERMRISASGNVSIGTTTDHLHKLEVSNGSDAENIIVVRGADENTEYAGIGVSGGNAVFTGGGVGSTSAGMAFRTASGGVEYERARIDSAGRLVVGSTSAFTNLGFSSSAAIQAIGAYNVGSIASVNNEANGNTCAVTSAKIRGTNAVNNGDVVGSHAFDGYDGGTFRTIARIDGVVSSAVSSNSISGELRFRTRTGSTQEERMRIQANGNVMVGNPSHFTSNVAKFDVVHPGANTAPTFVSRFFQETNNTGTDHACLVVRHAAASGSSTATVIAFQNSAGSFLGTIKCTNSATSYNTTSDYRLKENVIPISDGITRLKKLKPSRFNFIVDEAKTLYDGFLAHEVTTAVPEAITGTKDQMKAETYYEEGDTLPSGKVVGDIKTYSSTEPEYQGIDQSKLVPLLTAALQEAITKIETLETKVAALEAA